MPHPLSLVPTDASALSERLRLRTLTRDPMSRSAQRTSESTQARYRADLERFIRFAAIELSEARLSEADPLAALATLAHLGAETDPAHGGRVVLEDLAADWRESLRSAGRAAATVNRNLSSLRAALRALDRIPGALPDRFDPARFIVRGLESKPVRDSRGPQLATVRGMLIHAWAEGTPRAMRDALLISLIVIRGLRRSEALSIRLGDISDEPDRLIISICAKGREQRQPIPVPIELRETLSAWLCELRKLYSESGRTLSSASPIFPAIDRAGALAATRLSSDSVALITRRWAKRSGASALEVKRARPHGLRHTSITEVALSGASSLALAAFSRHSDPKTTARYLDRSEDLALDLAQRVAASVLPSDDSRSTSPENV
jgi:integrase